MSDIKWVEHDVIWLEPHEGAYPCDRQWCQDDVWGDEGVKYIRADLVAAKPAVAVKPDVGQEVRQNYNCPCIHPSQCDNSCLAPAVALTKLSLSKWSGWDSTNLPWSEAKHKDAVCYAAFGSSWSMEDAEVLIGFIEKTWCIRSALEDSTAPLPQDVITLVIVAREAFDTGDLPTEEQDALDKALESFSARVPYENEPEEDSK